MTAAGDIEVGAVVELGRHGLVPITMPGIVEYVVSPHTMTEPEYVRQELAASDVDQIIVVGFEIDLGVRLTVMLIRAREIWRDMSNRPIELRVVEKQRVAPTIN